MNRLVQSTLLAVIGFIAGSATFNGVFLNFVKPGLRWPLLVSCAVLVLLGAYGAIFEDDEDDEDDEDAKADEVYEQQGALGVAESSTVVKAFEPVQGHQRHGAAGFGEDGGAVGAEGHDHGRGPRVGWLLLVPFLLLGIVVPPPLGAYSAQRDSGLVRNGDAAGRLAPLPKADEQVALSLSNYSVLALYDESRPLEGRTVRLTGFVSSRKGGQGWALTRMALSCCAADGYAVKVDVQGGERLADNTWLEVVGTWVETPVLSDTTDSGLPIVRIASMRKVAAPANPYE